MLTWHAWTVLAERRVLGESERLSLTPAEGGLIVPFYSQAPAHSAQVTTRLLARESALSSAMCT